MPKQSDEQLRVRARALAQKLIIIDGHIDVPYRVSIYPEDLTQRTIGGDFDYPRARAGGLNAAFMAIYIEAHYQKVGGAKAHADRLIDMVWDFQDQWPEHFAIATSPYDILEQRSKNRIALALGLENGAALEGKRTNLDHFYTRGIRYITLCHSKDNTICDSSYDTARTWKGLSPFGKELVRAMNRIGMMIDVSHVSDDTFTQVMELSEAPIIASHSAARHFTPGWQRNLGDHQIEFMASRSGVMMVNFGSAFLSNAYRDQDDEALKATKADMSKKRVRRGSTEALKLFTEHRRKNPIGTVADVVQHIDHAVSIAGIDHVGLGSDFDGVFALPEGLQDVSEYPNLIFALLKRGYTEPEILKVVSTNTLRVWSEVEQQAH